MRGNTGTLNTAPYTLLFTFLLLHLISHAMTGMPLQLQHHLPPTHSHIFPSTAPSSFLFSSLFFFSALVHWNQWIGGAWRATTPLSNINHKSQAQCITRLVSNDNRHDECVCGPAWHYRIARQECAYVCMLYVMVGRVCGCGWMRYHSFFSV